ncbi:MAG: thioredoxin family protein [Microbacteriaceae bacterium]
MNRLPDLLLFTSAFCDPCMQTREVLAEVKRLLPAIDVRELDIVRDEDQAAAFEIRTTPTVVLADSAGTEIFRAAGVPTINQVLAAVAGAIAP